MNIRALFKVLCITGTCTVVYGMLFIKTLTWFFGENINPLLLKLSLVLTFILFSFLAYRFVNNPKVVVLSSREEKALNFLDEVKNFCFIAVFWSCITLVLTSLLEIFLVWSVLHDYATAAFFVLGLFFCPFNKTIKDWLKRFV